MDGNIMVATKDLVRLENVEVKIKFVKFLML